MYTHCLHHSHSNWKSPNHTCLANKNKFWTTYSLHMAKSICSFHVEQFMSLDSHCPQPGYFKLCLLNIETKKKHSLQNSFASAWILENIMLTAHNFACNHKLSGVSLTVTLQLHFSPEVGKLPSVWNDTFSFKIRITKFFHMYPSYWQPPQWYHYKRRMQLKMDCYKIGIPNFGLW